MSDITNNPETRQIGGNQAETSVIPPTKEELKTTEDLKRIASETKQKSETTETNQRDSAKLKAIVEKFGDMGWKSTRGPNGEDLGIPQTLAAPVLREDGKVDTEGWRTAVVSIDGKHVVLMEELDEDGKVKSSRQTSLESWELEQMGISAKQKIEAMNGSVKDQYRDEQELSTNPEEENMSNVELSEVVTQPESRRYKPGDKFTFLVHAPLDIRARTEALGLEEFNLTERPLNTTLIDQEHSWTFEGMSGLIIEPPSSQEKVLGAWSYDSGLNDMVREEAQPDPSTLLEETQPDNYNQVNITSGRVIGVYIRIREDGSDIGDPARSAQLREFAQQNDLPIAEIVVQPQEFTDKPPEIVKPNKDLTTIEFTANGKKFRVDALVANPARPLPGDEPYEGYFLRARSINQYGEAGGDVSDPESFQIIIDQLQPLLETDLEPSTRIAVEKMLRRYSSELSKLR